MPFWLTGLLQGIFSGLGNILAQAAGKLISYIPTKSQSERDKLYAETHTLVQTAIAAKFDPDQYAIHAGKLRDTIRSAANTASG